MVITFSSIRVNNDSTGGGASSGTVSGITLWSAEQTKAYIDEKTSGITPTEFKTINGEEIIGDGDIVISEPTKTSDLTNDSGYITIADVEAKGYLTEHQSLDGYAKTSDIPTKVSQLSNDSGYLTEHQSLSGYATEEWVNGKKYLTDASLDSYAKKSDVESATTGLAKTSDIPTKVSQLINDKGYLTEHQSLSAYSTTEEVKEMVKNVSVDLSGYYTSAQTDTKISNATSGLAKTSDIPVNTSDLTNDSGYITITDVENKGYLTEHQSLSAYSTTEEMNSAIKSATTDLAKASDIPTNTSDLTNNSGYITIADVEAKGYLTEHQSLSAYSTTEEVENKINDATSGLAKTSDIPTKVSELTNDKGYLTEHQSLSAYSTTEEVENKINTATSGLAKTSDIPTKVSELENDKNYLTKHQSLTAYSTTEEVENKINDAVSGIPTQFKTINGSAITGNGDLVIEGGSGKVYSGGTGINVDNVNNIISITGDTSSKIATTSIDIEVVEDDTKMMWYNREQAEDEIWYTAEKEITPIASGYSAVCYDEKTKRGIIRKTTNGTWASLSGLDFTYVIIPDTPNALGLGMFSACTALTAVTVNRTSELTTLRQTFYNCTSLKRVDFPYTKKIAGEWAFRGCSALTTVTMPEVTAFTNNYGFVDCTSLKTISLPKAETFEGDYLFWDCTSLMNVELPLVKTISGHSLFIGCTGLEYIEFPASLYTASGSTWFSGCTNLKTVVLHSPEMELNASMSNTLLSGWSGGTVYVKNGNYYFLLQSDSRVRYLVTNRDISGGTSVDLSKYYTSAQTNTAISNATSGLAKTTAIPTKVSQLTNDSGYLTSHQSLSAYSTTSQMNTAISNATSGLAKTTAIPTKVSQLTNDKGYLTEHQSLSAYSTTAQMNTAISNATSGLAKTSDIPTKVSELDNDSGYLTEHQSLTEYAKKTDIPTSTSSLTNNSGYITIADVEAKGYLTEHQSLDGYAKTSDIPTKVSQLTNDSGYLTEHQSLSAYSTTEEVDGKISTATSGLAKTSDIPVNTSDLTNDSGYITIADVEAKGYLTEHQSLSGYATEEWVEGKGYLTEHQSLSAYTTTDQVHNAILNAFVSGVSTGEISTEYSWDGTVSDVPAIFTLSGASFVETNSTTYGNTYDITTQTNEIEGNIIISKPLESLEFDFVLTSLELSGRSWAFGADMVIDNYTTSLFFNTGNSLNTGFTNIGSFTFETGKTYHYKLVESGSTSSYKRWSEYIDDVEIKTGITGVDKADSFKIYYIYNSIKILGIACTSTTNITYKIPTVDGMISNTSTNCVQNKVVKAYVDDKLGDIETILASI